MTLMLATGGGSWPALPAAPASLPYDSITVCVTPTYDGSGNVTHPSVVDMGRRWNGYRWWLADTPYPNKDPAYENPSIWGSNDRVNWEVPPGLTNPIDTSPRFDDGRPETAFNSDPDLVWDPEGQRLVCYWRDADSEQASSLDFCAATSTDGSTWVHHGTVLTISSPLAWRSPALARMSPTDWRMWTIDNDTRCIMWTAPSPLGPWTNGGLTSLDGAPFYGWHGDFIHDGGVFYGLMVAVANTGPCFPAVSLDGLAWYAGAAVFGESYRSCMMPPRNGEVEVWYAKTLRLRYTRIPAAYWTDLLPQ